jgi:single-stranded-DNA-specific exonuclease
MIKDFIAINAIRRAKIDGVVQEIKKQISGSAEPIIFIGSSEWDSNLLGTVSSILNIDYQKPVFIYKKLDDYSQGTVRSTDAIDSVALMKNCKDLLVTFGGHPKASGFRVKNENLEKLKTCLIENINKPAV